MYKIGTHEFFLLSHQLGEVKGSWKYEYEIWLRCLSAELGSAETKYWENWKIPKSGWLDPLYQDIWLKVCYEVNLLGKMPLHQKGPKTHCKWASCYKTKTNWEVMLIPKNWYCLYQPHWHVGQLCRKKIWIFLGYFTDVKFCRCSS